MFSKMNLASHRPLLRHCLALALAVAISQLASWAVAGAAQAAPADAAKILQNAGQTGVAQNLGLPSDKKAFAEQIAKDAATKTGAKVYIVLLKRDEDPQAYAGIYGDLNMQGKDLLIVSNGTKWEIKAAALSHDAKQSAVNKGLSQEAPPLERLKSVTQELTTALTQARTGKLSWNEFQHQNAGKGWNPGQMSREYQRYQQSGQLTTTVGTREVPLVRSESSGWGSYAFLGVLVAAIVGVVLWRRKKRDAGLGEELKQALQGPDQIITDIYMNLDGLEAKPNFGKMLDSVTACQAKLDELKKGPPTREAIARARALNDEANRLRRAFDEARMAR